MRRISHPILKLLCTIVCFIILWAVVFFRIPCPINHFFGIICPGCGMTHAFLSLFQLDIPGAFRANPLFPLVPLAFLYLIFDGKLFGEKADQVILISSAAAAAVIYIIRLVLYLT